MPRIESIYPRKIRGEPITCTLCNKECNKHGQSFQQYQKRWISAQTEECVKCSITNPYPFVSS